MMRYSKLDELVRISLKLNVVARRKDINQNNFEFGKQKF